MGPENSHLHQKIDKLLLPNSTLSSKKIIIAMFWSIKLDRLLTALNKKKALIMSKLLLLLLNLCYRNACLKLLWSADTKFGRWIMWGSFYINFLMRLYILNSLIYLTSTLNWSIVYVKLCIDSNRHLRFDIKL